MLIDYLQNLDWYSWQIILLLIIAGFLVGVVNTFAGSGTAISYSFFMLIGLPAGMANGTIRLGVIMQTMAASFNFWRKGALYVRLGLLLSIPIVAGSVVGAQIAVSINQDVFENVLGVVMLLMLFFIFYKPEHWIRQRSDSKLQKPKWWHYALYFVIGAYGGFIHIGVGIFLLAAMVLVSGLDLVRANGVKVFVVFLYSPFVLAVFMLNNQVEYGIGLIAALGNLAGGLLASQFAVNRGAGFVRWILIVVIVLFTAKLFGVYEWMF